MKISQQSCTYANYLSKHFSQSACLSSKKLVAPRWPREPDYFVMKGHPASLSVGARGSRTEMEMTRCDVTINPTAVNKVSTSYACASSQGDLFISCLLPPLFSPPSFPLGCDSVYLLFKANYFVHQNVTMQAIFSLRFVTD